MSTLATTHPTIDKADQLKNLGDRAFRRGKMSRAFAFYQEAISEIEPIWFAAPEQSIGLKLAGLYRSSAYPAWRKAFARNTGDRDIWRLRAVHRERQGVDLAIKVARQPFSIDDNELVGIICNISNIAFNLLRGKTGEEISCEQIDQAERYINEAYLLLTKVRSHEKMPESLHYRFEEQLARIAFYRGRYAQALAFIEPVIAYEQRRLDRARLQKKKLPPPNWQKAPLELRQRIIEKQLDTGVTQAQLALPS